MTTRTKSTAIQSRVESANKFIELIASRGRRYFEYIHKGVREGGDDWRQVAKFARDRKGKLFFWNEWSLKWIYVSRPGAWRGFHHGGTLHSLVSGIVVWIKTGEPYIHPSFLDHKHWAYPQVDMHEIIQYGQQLGIVKECEHDFSIHESEECAVCSICGKRDSVDVMDLPAWQR